MENHNFTDPILNAINGGKNINLTTIMDNLVVDTPFHFDLYLSPWSQWQKIKSLQKLSASCMEPNEDENPKYDLI